MTNRDKIMNTNLYDLLLHINSKITDYTLPCIIDIIEIKTQNCPEHCKCDICLQDYLNRESTRPLKLEKREYK